MKIQRFSEFQSEIQFPNFQNYREVYFESFLSTDLGKVYLAVPWQKLVDGFSLKEYKKGPRSVFSPRGKIALMFLKHICGVSDRKLIAQLNANIDYQIFCDLVIHPGERIKNYKMVSEIRCELSKRLDEVKIQKILAEAWRGYCDNKDSITCDATCYESYIRYPTDVKLLYEAVRWNYERLWAIRKMKKQRMIRSKMNKWKTKYQSYSKSKKPSRKSTRSVTRGLLRLLEKVHDVLKEEELGLKMHDQYWDRRRATEKILKQQRGKFYSGIKPTDRIVSMDKPYLRPIVRGKEIKKVEFGAKVHKVQIDGISFIEHLSFDAYNEGTRLRSSIYLAQEYMHTKVKILGADGIYANNANRTYVTLQGIKTDFKRKGRKTKHQHHYNQLHRIITKERASRLEGSFGTDKEHFLLKRIKARTELTERLWIFFGIHTSNALKIGRRIAKYNKLAA